MTGKWSRTAAVAAIALAAATTACGNDGGDGGVRQSVKVGGIFDLSGDTADIGTPYAEGIKGFVEHWSQEGDGPEIDLFSEDYKYDIEVAERLYDSLKEEGVVAIQAWGTGDAEKLRHRVTSDRMPFMSASSAETLTRPSATPFNFVPVTSYSDQMRIAMRWISERARGAQVALFHHESRFGTSPKAAGEQAAKRLGLGFESHPMPQDAKDYWPQLRRARSQGARVVIIQNTSIPAARLAKNIAERHRDMQIVCLNWCADELFVELAARAADGTVGVMPFAPVSERPDGLARPEAFLSRSGRTIDQEGLHYVQGWYTMALMAEAIRRAAGNGNVKVTRASVKRALEQMEAFDTGGASAPMDFTATSHVGMKVSALYRVEDDRWRKIPGPRQAR